MSTFGFETTALEVVEGVDLSGKRALVTGGASGIGVETVRALAKAGAEVTIAARDVDAGEQVATETGATERRLPRPRQARVRRGLRPRLGRPAAHPGQQRRRDGDPGAHAQRRRAGDAVRDQPRRALRARARPARRAGGRGRADRQRQLVRAPALAGDLRRPQLRASATTTRGRPTGSPRPPTCCSRSARPPAGRPTASTANALMPGGIATNLQRHTGPDLIEQAKAAGMRLKTPEQGAATSVLLAVSPELEGVGGRYYEDCAEAEVVERRGDGAAAASRPTRWTPTTPIACGSCPNACSARRSELIHSQGRWPRPRRVANIAPCLASPSSSWTCSSVAKSRSPT